MTKKIRLGRPSRPEKGGLKGIADKSRNLELASNAAKPIPKACEARLVR